MERAVDKWGKSGVLLVVLGVERQRIVGKSNRIWAMHGWRNCF